MDGIRWMCKRKGGHVLGLVVHDNGHDGLPLVQRLLLYRHAIDPGAEQPAEVDVLTELTYYTPGIKCDICGARRDWLQSRELTARLLRRYKNHTYLPE